MSFEVFIKEALASVLREQLPSLLSETLPQVLSTSLRNVNEDEMITTAQLADETNSAPITWVMMRVAGRGPRFYKIGRSVRYSRADIREYLRYNAVRNGSRSGSVCVDPDR